MSLTSVIAMTPSRTALMETALNGKWTSYGSGAFSSSLEFSESSAESLENRP